MNVQQARAACRNPQCIPTGSHVLVINGSTGEPIEGHFGAVAATEAARWCNEHEARNGRPEVYRAEPVDPA